MTRVRLYLPAILIAVWAIVLVALRVSHVIRGIAWLTIAAAFMLQINEAIRQHSWDRAAPAPAAPVPSEHRSHRRGRRATDSDRKWPQLVRDFWLFVITAVVLVALSNSSDAVTSVQQGRQTSLRVTCAVQSAVAQAGRQVITGSNVPPPATQERALEALGFPPFKVRHRQALKAADDYVATISKHIDAQIGRKGDGLVKSDGTIDCTRLAELAKIPTR